MEAIEGLGDYFFYNILHEFICYYCCKILLLLLFYSYKDFRFYAL